MGDHQGHVTFKAPVPAKYGTFLEYIIITNTITIRQDHVICILLQNVKLEFANMIKTICVIGAGPAGLASLKIILDSPQYQAGLWKPTAFEARECVGGVW